VESACEHKKWADDAPAYNEPIAAWHGFDDATQRAVRENCAMRKFSTGGFESNYRSQRGSMRIRAMTDDLAVPQSGPEGSVSSEAAVV
jgi:hypothetical protein